MPVDLSTWALVIGTVTSLAAVAFGIHTWQRYKDMPLSREQMLEQRVDDLEAMVRILQERIRELEDKLAYYEGPTGTQTPRRRTTTRPKAKRLTGEQLKALREMLLNAFDVAEWQSLLLDIDHPLDRVALGDNLTDIAVRALAQANAEGWIGDLISAAAEARPRVPELQTLAAELLKALK